MINGLPKKQYPSKMKPNLHKFTGYVQPLTAKTWPDLPVYFKKIKIFIEA